MSYTPKFSITSNILNDIVAITEAKTVVERSRVLPERQAVLRQRAAVRMAHTSTKIEGNKLAEYEVEKVLAGEDVNADQQSIDEVANYHKALGFLDTMAGKTKFEVSDILNLHKLVMRNLAPEGKRGRFRPNQIFVVTPMKDYDKVHYVGPPANEVEKLIEELLEWVFVSAVEEKIHPVIVSGVLHFQFESIHPFTDGNGRTGRLLILLYLMQTGWDFRKLITLENFFSQNRGEYISQLEKTGETFEQHTSADLTEWLGFFCQAFLHEATKVRDQILPIALAADEGMTQVFLDKDQLKILDFVATMGRITSQDAADILSMPKRTAQTKLKELVDAKVIWPNGKGPATYYTLKNQSQ